MQRTHHASLAGELHWTAVKLTGWPREEKELEISYRTLVRYLHEHDYARRIPHPVPEPPDRDSWLRQREDCARRLEALLGNPAAAVFFGDEETITAELFSVQGKPLDIGGVDDHVHILCLFPRTQSVADVVKETKRVSTNWHQEQGPGLRDLHWQAGYRVFSVSKSSVVDVVEYIGRQEEHHLELTFQDKYRAILKKHSVDFDERYVWD